MVLMWVRVGGLCYRLIMCVIVVGYCRFPITTNKITTVYTIMGRGGRKQIGNVLLVCYK